MGREGIKYEWYQHHVRRVGPIDRGNGRKRKEKGFITSNVRHLSPKQIAKESWNVYNISSETRVLMILVPLETLGKDNRLS